MPKKQPIMNLYPTLNAINMLTPDYREAGRWLMHHTQIMAFRQLCHSIRASCLQLRDQINQWDNFSLITLEGKSQEWMADIAYRFLPKMPNAVIPTGDGYCPWETLTHSNNFLIFDDAIYSGEQLKKYLENLYANIMRQIYQKKGAFEEPKHLYFIVGACPKAKKWREHLQAHRFEAYNVHIHILANELHLTCGEMMQNEKLPEQFKNQIRHLGGDPRKPILTTEWKMPDATSLAKFVSKGFVWGYEMDFEWYSSLNGVGPITDVIPPYKESRTRSLV
jgi:hypothetical protein